jgi:hypothetical protein
MTHRILTLALALAALPVFGQSAERPDVRVGDSWTYREVDRADGNKASSLRLTVLAVDADTIRMERRNADRGDHESLEVSRELNFVSDGSARNTPNRMLLSFPLAVGKVSPVKFAWVANDSKGTAAGKCTVASFEKVKVAAGEFDAFRVECRIGYSTEGSYANGTETLWYAPAARGWVRMEREVRGPNYRNSITREVTALELRD